MRAPVASCLSRASAFGLTVPPPEVLERYRSNAVQPGAMTAMLNYYRANLAIGRYGGHEENVDVPTLLLWGENDSALSNELVPGTCGFVPNLTIRMVPGVSHWVPEEAPLQVNSAIRDWLGELRRTSTFM